MANNELIAALNKALAWELRAIAMYAHYAAYVSGIHRLHLATHFNTEVNESVTHAATVRSAISAGGGLQLLMSEQSMRSSRPGAIEAASCSW